MRVLSLVKGVAAIAAVLGLQASLGAQRGVAFDVEVVPVDPAQAASEPVPDVLAFELAAGDRMTVPVSVDGQGPYRFLVDTGAERTVISRELARRLALEPGRNVTVHSMTEVAQVATALIPRLEVSRKTLTDIHAPAFAAANLGAAGMLGVDSLQSQRVLFDFEAKTMTIVPSQKRRQRWEWNAIVITGRSLYGRLILADAEVDGQKILVVMDTGSQITIGNDALRRKLAAKKRLGPMAPVHLVSVTGGRLTADYTTVRKIRIGDIEINDMPIGFADVHPFRQLQLTDRPALLLGMDVLQLFDRVSVDFARREVRFLPPDDLSEAGGWTRMVRSSATPFDARSSAGI